MRAGDARDERGFTLLEVLVAFAIAALALAVLFRGALDGVHITRIAGHEDEALVRARSHLAAIGRDVAIAPGHYTGDDGDGYRWALDIRALGSAPAAHTALFAVAVAISWTKDGGTHSVNLATERLGPAP
jgi:general secretion pathway protein I